MTDVVAKIVDFLTPFTSEDRQRIVQAALTLLGESQAPLKPKDADVDDGGTAGDATNLPAKAKTWMKQNGLKLAELEQVFHIENGHAEVIAGSIPGKNDKAKTHNAYVLQGLNSLLSSGEPSFDDKTARALCNTLGCYNSANHSVYMGDVGNRLTGSKDKGWKLTAPGMAHGAVLVKEITKKPE